MPNSAAAAGGDGKADVSALRAALLELLEEQQREAELWLERHHVALRHAVEGALPGPSHGAASRRGVKTSETAGESAAAASANAGVDMPIAGAAARDTPPKAAANEAAGGQPRGGTAPKAAAAGAEATDAAAEPEQLPPDAAAAEPGQLLARSQTQLSDGCGCNHQSSRDSKGPSTFMKALKGTTEIEGVTIRQKIFQEVQNGICFEIAMGILIIMNTVTMFVQLEIEGRSAHDILWAEPDDKPVESLQSHSALQALNIFFTVAFLIELVLKLCCLRCKYFHSAFNDFDFVVVVITTVDLCLSLRNVSGNMLNLGFLRTIKMLRFARVLRVVRIMEIFQQLRVLMRTIILSFTSIFWSLLILLIFMLVTALLLCSMLQETILDRNAGNELRSFADEYYGTSSKALYTIYEVTFSGCWPTYARYLITNHDWGSVFAVIFTWYVTFIVFTLIRIIYALLLKDTMQAAANDADQLVQERMAHTKATLAKLEDLFHEADESGDGCLTREEFEEILKYPKVKEWLHALGVQAHDRDALFDMLDESGDHLLNYEEFTDGIMRLKGTATQQHMLATQRDTRRILRHCEVLREVLAYERGAMPQARAMTPVPVAQRRAAQRSRSFRARSTASLVV